MKRYNYILQSEVEPTDKNVLWLHKKSLLIYGNNGWEPVIKGLSRTFTDYMECDSVNDMYALNTDYLNTGTVLRVRELGIDFTLSEQNKWESSASNSSEYFIVAPNTVVLDIRHFKVTLNRGYWPSVEILIKKNKWYHPSLSDALSNKIKIISKSSNNNAYDTSSIHKLYNRWFIDTEPYEAGPYPDTMWVKLTSLSYFNTEEEAKKETPKKGEFIYNLGNAYGSGPSIDRFIIINSYRGGYAGNLCADLYRYEATENNFFSNATGLPYSVMTNALDQSENLDLEQVEPLGLFGEILQNQEYMQILMQEIDDLTTRVQKLEKQIKDMLANKTA